MHRLQTQKQQFVACRINFSEQTTRKHWKRCEKNSFGIFCIDEPAKTVGKAGLKQRTKQQAALETQTRCIADSAKRCDSTGACRYKHMQKNYCKRNRVAFRFITASIWNIAGGTATVALFPAENPYRHTATETCTRHSYQEF